MNLPLCVWLFVFIGVVEMEHERVCLAQATPSCIALFSEAMWHSDNHVETVGLGGGAGGRADEVGRELCVRNLVFVSLVVLNKSKERNGKERQKIEDGL